MVKVTHSSHQRYQPVFTTKKLMPRPRVSVKVKLLSC